MPKLSAIEKAAKKLGEHGLEVRGSNIAHQAENFEKLSSEDKLAWEKAVDRHDMKAAGKRRYGRNWYQAKKKELQEKKSKASLEPNSSDNSEYEEKDPGSPGAPDAPDESIEEEQRKEAQQKIETARIKSESQNKEIEDTAENSAKDNGPQVKELKDQKNSTIKQYSKNEAVVQEELEKGDISEEEAQERLGATENKNDSGGLWGFVKNHKTMSGIGAFAAYEVLSGNGGQKSNSELYSDPYNQ